MINNGYIHTIRLYFIVLSYVGIIAFVLLHDEAIFSEINDYYSQYRQYMFHKKTLSKEEYARAFNLDRTTNSNVILIWSQMFGELHPVGTPEDGCVFTYDRSAIDVAKAVVFHFAETHDEPSWLPLDKRKENQRWVWWCIEPPWNTRYVFRKKLTPLNNVFNWTMTYRTDSDVYFPYYQEWAKVNRTTAELIAEKTEISLGVWVVSNCRPSRRGAIIEELQKHIKIDIFGKCTKNPLCGNQCGLDIIRRYKFYFSFENSRCKDYITEKFTVNGLLGGAVPVVMGPPRVDYERIAPAHSFIHVDDFPSIPKLAEYLLELDKDDKKYGKYLKWRSNIDSPPQSQKEKSLFDEPTGWKAMCDKIKQDSESSKKETVSNLAQWWFGDGYDFDTDNLPNCHPGDGASGTSLHPYIASGYLVGILLLCLLTIKCCKYHRHK